VIVRWRGGDEVRRCVNSLRSHGDPHLAHIVLVDSGSGDGGAERLRSEFSDVEVMALAENRGFAFAAGCGAAEGSEPLLLLLNPDIEVEARAIDRLVETFYSRSRCAGVVPLLVGSDGELQYRWQLRKLPTALDLALGKPGAPAFRSPPQTSASCQQPAAAAWLVRRSVWQALGGLDPTFEPAWWEDVDFCTRLRDRLGDPDFPANEGFVVEPGARMQHGGGSSVAALGRAAFLSAYYTNLLRYTTRHHPGRLGLVRQSLRLVLSVRMLIRPGQRNALQAAIQAIRKATPSAPGGSPPPTRAS
jgi:GT2 family glycosyltransferase